MVQVIYLIVTKELHPLKAFLDYDEAKEFFEDLHSTYVSIYPMRIS